MFNMEYDIDTFYIDEKTKKEERIKKQIREFIVDTLGMSLEDVYNIGVHIENDKLTGIHINFITDSETD